MKINKVLIYTDKIVEVKTFYVDFLGFELKQDTNDYFSISVGRSELIVKYSETLENPYYHFAFDIPPEMFDEVKVWLQERVGLLTEEGQDEIYFSGFDAKSLYFYDPAYNIVEFMARNENRNKTQANHFTVREILGISEIGLVIDNLEQSMTTLKNYDFRNIANYIDEDSLNFIFNNNESNYLLLTKAERRWLFSDKLAKILPITVETDKELIEVVEGELRVERLS
jgi:catechol 2,3-dioxygenase-like lactoylglutathione lyase family enzyme